MEKGMGITMGMDLWEERINIFEDTRQLYETNSKLIASILDSKKHQKVIAEGVNLPAFAQKDGMPAKVLVSKRRSLEAARQYRGRKVCALNFASATNPGGGVTNGLNAQEEAICRCSTLYACISDKEIVGRFYEKHQHGLEDGQLTALYNDDCIYTPDVTVFKTDTEKPELMPEKEWYGVDIVSCAAPNLRSGLYSQWSQVGAKASEIGEDGLMGLHKKRLHRILEIARMNNAEIMVLGAFGCGAFQNPPDIVAHAMLDVISGYLRDFSVIEIAIYCRPYDERNYDVFRQVLAPVCNLQE